MTDLDKLLASLRDDVPHRPRSAPPITLTIVSHGRFISLFEADGQLAGLVQYTENATHHWEANTRRASWIPNQRHGTEIGKWQALGQVLYTLVHGYQR